MGLQVLGQRVADAVFETGLRPNWVARTLFVQRIVNI
jgi:hypothetical protein